MLKENRCLTSGTGKFGKPLEEHLDIDFELFRMRDVKRIKTEHRKSMVRWRKL